MYLKQRQVIRTPPVTMKPDAVCQLNVLFYETNVAAQPPLSLISLVTTVF